MWLPRELEWPGSAGHFDRRGTRIAEALEGADVILRCGAAGRLHEPALPLDEYILQYQLTPDACACEAMPSCCIPDQVRGLEIDPGRGRAAVLRTGASHNGLAVRMALSFVRQWRGHASRKGFFPCC